MPLDYFVSSVDGLDENISKLYVPAQSGTGYHLDVKDVAPVERLNEFRDNNVKLMKQLSEYKGIQPEKFVEYEKIAQQYVADQKAGKRNLGSEELESLVKDRVTSMKSEYDADLSKLAKERDDLQSTLHNQILHVQISEAAAKSGVLSSAIPDLVWRAQSQFKMEDGQLVIRDTTGQIVYDKSGTAPLNVRGWVENLKLSGEAGHLFNQPNGSGAYGSGSHQADFSKMSSVDKIRYGLNNLK